MPKKTAVTAQKNKSRRKELIQMFEKLAYRYGRHNVWNDFIYMCASSMSQRVDYRQNRLHRFNSYDKEAQAVFPKMFGELVLAFEAEQFGDILGEIYSSLELTNAKAGQFFTPYNVCKMMAAINMGDGLTAEIERKGYISVSDPCGGAGAMLIAFAEQCMDSGINYQQSVLFVAQDIDPAVALMCYVQMSLLAMPGYVVIGNSLIPSENYDIWYTPMYALQGFQHRTQTDTAAPEEPAEVVADVMLREDEDGQLSFDFAS